MSEYDDQLEAALSGTSETEDQTGRFSIPEPEIRQEGNVTVYENFKETLTRLDRDEEHVLQFLQSELGTSAQLDRGRARLVGSFGADRVREIVDEYADEYVICRDCGSPDTRLESVDATTYLRCEACGARTPRPD